MEKNIVLKQIPAPVRDHAAPVLLSDETMNERKEKILARMRAQGIDQLIIYDDVEHGGNFMYLTGFFTRFEEGLLLLNADGSAVMLLGNHDARLSQLDNPALQSRNWALLPAASPISPRASRLLVQMLMC